jgi:hypothetical protein
LSNERWLAVQRERLLASTHHHWVFTLPHDLLPLWRYNRVVMQDLLFRSVADVLAVLSRDANYLGAQPAFSLTLHTWGRNLSLHPHIHCLIAHGGLNAESQWVTPRKKCLFPARVMMQLFRGKFLSALKAKTDLVLPDDMTATHFRKVINRLGRTDWVVHCCKPYRHGRGVVTYLSRYVKTGPFKNRQLRTVDEQSVTFAYQSHQTRRHACQKFSITDFLFRLCDHIPQHGKFSLRHYGLYHPCRHEALDEARRSLGQTPVPEVQPVSWQAYLMTRASIPRCDICQAPLRGLKPLGG